MSLHEVVRDLLPGVLSDLKDLVAIESISADPARSGEVERSALAIIRLLVDAGCPDARVIRGTGGARRHRTVSGTGGHANRVPVAAPRCAARR